MEISSEKKEGKKDRDRKKKNCYDAKTKDKQLNLVWTNFRSVSLAWKCFEVLGTYSKRERKRKGLEEEEEVAIKN